MKGAVLAHIVSLLYPLMATYPSIIYRGLRALLQLLVMRLPLEKVRSALEVVLEEKGASRSLALDTPRFDREVEYGELVAMLRILCGTSHMRT